SFDFFGSRQSRRVARPNEDEPPSLRKIDAAIQRRYGLARQLALFNDQATKDETVGANRRAQTTAYAQRQFLRRLTGQSTKRIEARRDSQRKLRPAAQSHMLRNYRLHVDSAHRP